MRKITGILLIFLTFTSGIIAQINFEKGSFTLEDGQKTECYIKNVDWENNPSKFEYKLSLSGETKTVRMANLKTVVINNAFKFEKHTVPYDDADRSIKQLTYKRTPDFEDRVLMLNVLIEGEATLYSYVDGSKRSYYYKKGNDTIKPLIYKVYTNDNHDVLYNKRYQQQLLTELPCATLTEKKIIRVDYQADDLTSFFRAYNECKGDTSVEFNKKKKIIFHLKAFAGVYNSSAVSDLAVSAFFARGVETPTALSPTFGVELEYIFPFNKNKWGFFVAPNYSSYQGESEFLDLSIRRNYKLEYSAIQVPFGFRHYMFLNDTSKIFISGAVMFDILLDAKGSGSTTVEKDNFSASTGTSFGLGYSYDKYSIEARYIPNRELLNTPLSSIELQQQFYVTIGYTIF